MGTPASWTQTATLYTATSRYVRAAAYQSGYWLASGINNDTWVVNLFYATDPRAASWTSVTLFTYSSSVEALRGVCHDGTYHIVPHRGDGPSGTRYQLSYATSPTGTWTTHTISAATANGYFFEFQIANGNYILAGNDTSSVGCFYYSTTLTGTYTKVSLAGTNLVSSVRYEGGYFYALVRTSTNIEIWRCSTINGTWASYTALTGYSLYYDQDSFAKQLTQHGDGTWTILCQDTSINDFYTLYSSSLSGSWTSHDITSDSAFSGVYAMAYGPGYWVVCGNQSGTRITYATAIGGSYTALTVAATGFGAWIEYGSSEFVLFEGQKVYCMTGGGLPPVAAAVARYLRQRQSPVRTPSRVRSPQLRQRQRPETT